MKIKDRYKLLNHAKEQYNKTFNLDLQFKYLSKKALYNLLKENGQMLIVNQGKEEAKIQEKMLNSLNIKYSKLNELNSAHFKYQNKRFGFLIKK